MKVLDRFQNTDFVCEYKYDGERAQVPISIVSGRVPLPLLVGGVTLVSGRVPEAVGGTD